MEKEGTEEEDEKRKLKGGRVARVAGRRSRLAVHTSSGLTEEHDA